MKAGSRVLRPSTIISDDLYIRRAADKQLDQIIEDMGRPGYVLVARQMGKTNLLLHMKRRQELDRNIVVYVDLSERFEGARTCFRNIIDLAIETNVDLLSNVKPGIDVIRAQSELDPSSEYGKCLRELLRAIPDKKIIVILDEVDSLVNANYSDVILSQVRSMYFLRANYREYERLTYVLSGVAEPSDLIKDKNISPFNIGEKIYLYDFTENEFREFLRRSKLNIRSSVSNAIYYWTGGNPRMTWDVCAGLEELMASGVELAPSHVEQIVRKLYLEAHDRPPIDHMRSLVAQDGQLKSALMTLRYGKGDTLDDRVRSRLYLAGITNSADRTSRIKNPIVDAALSDSWLAQLTADEHPLANVGEYFARSEYLAVTQAFARFKNEGGDFNTCAIGDQMHLAVSQFRMSDYDGAIASFKVLLNRTKGDLKTTVLYHLGSSLVLIGKYFDAIEYLEEGAYRGSGSLQLAAKMLLATALFKAGTDDGKRVGGILSEISDSISLATDNVDDGDLRASALYDLAATSTELGDADSASLYLRYASGLASDEQRPGILLTRYATMSPGSERRSVAQEAVGVVLSLRPRISPSSTSPLRFSERTLGLLLSAAITEGLSDDIAALSEYGLFLLTLSSKFELLVRLSRALVQAHDTRAVGPLLNYAEGIGEPSAKEAAVLEMYRLLSSHGEAERRGEYSAKYLEIFKAATSPYNITADDALFLVSMAQSYIGELKYNEALDVISLAEPYVIESDAAYTWPVFLYIKMTCFIGLNSQPQARGAAHEIIASVENEKITKNALTEIGTLYSNMADQARKYLSRTSFMYPDPLKKIGRNEKVRVRNKKTNVEELVKFKVVEEKIRSGEVELLEVMPVKN